VSNGRHSASTDGEESDEEIVVADVSTGNKSTYMLEVNFTVFIFSSPYVCLGIAFDEM